MGRGIDHRGASRIGTWLLVCAYLVPGVSRATSARCSATFSGGRALVDVELTEFFDPELLRLVRLGLEGRIRVELSLYQRRALWFGEELAAEVLEMVITYSPSTGAYALGHRQVSDLSEVKLERMALRSRSELESGEHYRIEVSATLQVVTAASLGQVAKWMAGEQQAPLVRESVLSSLASQFVRETRTRCDLQRPSGKSQ